MPATSSDHVHILSRAFDSWVVEFRIDVAELLDQKQLLNHLRGVKQVISTTQPVPESCLVFDGIVRKTRVDNWVDVVVRIRKRIMESSAPKVTFKDETSATNTAYSHMQALLDVYYLDEFEQLITLDRVMRCIRESGVLPRFVDEELIAQKVAEVLETQTPCRNVPISVGRLPEAGSDAEIEFYFQAVAESHDVDVLYSSRRVSRGDLLCRKTPRTEGGREGTNVLGQSLPPRPGLDIKFYAGANAALSLDETDIVAAAEGVVVVSRVNRKIRISGGVKEIPESVTIKVNPIMRIDGNSVVDMTTTHAVEIIGDLRVGSRILTDSEVFVGGDVEDGVNITAADDIMVKGEISGATLSSQGRITTGKSVRGSNIQAQGDITISGDITDSTVSGEAVTAESASGSKIVGRKSVTLQRIDADEGNIMSTICVGMQEFFMQRLHENQQFLEAANTNLERIKLVVGEEIFDRVTESNAQTMLMKFLSGMHLETNLKARQQVDVYRKLIEAIAPTRALVEQKARESLEITRKLADQSGESEGVIVVRERIASKTIANVNGIQTTLAESDHAVNVRRVGNRLDIQTSEGPASRATNP